ncbi:MAG TPA: O-antigen ligase domain-containing protein [Phormidium sp.]
MIEKFKRFWESVNIAPENLPEKVIWYYMTGTYVLYFIGAQHLLVPAIGWGMALYLIKKLWQQNEDTPEAEKIRIPLGVWIWIICMLMMQVSLVGSHLDFDMGMPRIIRSTINFFARTWALFALFPLMGCFKIRPKLIYRAACILAIQSIIFIIIGLIAHEVLPRGLLYLSPLQKLGGVGEEYYNVFLYATDGETGKLRLYLFTPWAPALGLVGNIYLFLTMQEPNKKLRWIGMFGSAAMVWGSDSRLGLLCLLSLPIIRWVLANFTKPFIQIGAGVTSLGAGIFGIQILTWYKDFRAQFDSQRAGSSRVREVLGNLAVYRWSNDAPIWGHGLLEPKGPAVVTNKPIGSHHTWFGLLFANGIVGFIAFAVALAWSFIEFLVKAHRYETAKVALGLILVLFMFSFGENLEALIYIYWPALVMMGIAFKEKLFTLSGNH